MWNSRYVWSPQEHPWISMKISEETRGRDRDEQRTSEQALGFFRSHAYFPRRFCWYFSPGGGEREGPSENVVERRNERVINDELDLYGARRDLRGWIRPPFSPPLYFRKNNSYTRHTTNHRYDITSFRLAFFSPFHRLDGLETNRSATFSNTFRRSRQIIYLFRF